MNKKDLEKLVQECISEVMSEGYDEFQRADKGSKGVAAKDKAEEDTYGAGYAAGEKAAKAKYKKLAEAYKQLKEEGFGLGPKGLDTNDDLDEAAGSDNSKLEKYKKYTYTLDGKTVKPEVTFLNNILKAILNNKIYNIGAPKNGKAELNPESGKKGTYTESTDLDEAKKTLWWIMIEKDGKRFYLKNSPYFPSEEEAHDYAKEHNVKDYSLKSREENVDDEGKIIETRFKKENIHNTAQMGGVTTSKGTAGYIDSAKEKSTSGEYDPKARAANLAKLAKFGPKK